MKKFILIVTLLALFGAVNLSVSAQEGATPRTVRDTDCKLSRYACPKSAKTILGRFPRTARTGVCQTARRTEIFMEQTACAFAGDCQNGGSSKRGKSVQEAVELDPRLAEAYTVLSELSS